MGRGDGAAARLTWATEGGASAWRVQVACQGKHGAWPLEASAIAKGDRRPQVSRYSPEPARGSAWLSKNSGFHASIENQKLLHKKLNLSSS